MEELSGQGVQLRRWLHQAQRQRCQRYGDQAQQQGEPQRQQQTLAENPAQRATVGTPGSLGGETGGAHAQETEHADQQGIQAAADRHRAELVGMRQMADDRAVYQRHQRHGNIGKNHRRGQRPDLPMGRAVPPGVAQRVH
ncbi:hypothetical protein D3C78_1344720 [compost metagenome]